MKRGLLVLMFLSVTISQGTYPMAVVNKWATRISVGAYLYPYFVAAKSQFLDNYGESFDLECRDVKPATDEFVRKTLLEVGYPESMVNSIRVRTNGDIDYHSNSILKTLYIPKKLEKKVENNKLSSTKKSEAQGFLIHEGGHLYHHHSHESVASVIGIPLIIQGMAFGSGRLLTRLAGGIPHEYLLQLSINKLTIGQLLKHVGFFGAASLFNHLQEKQADFEIIKRVKDPVVLKEVMRAFVVEDEKFIHRFKKNPWVLRNRAIAYFLFWDKTHPHPLKRAEYFRKAAEELEKKQQEQK